MRPWEAILFVLVILGVVCLSVLLPSQPGPLADPQERIVDPSPVWFLFPIALAGRMLPWWAAPLVIVFGLVATGSVAWVLGGRFRDAGGSAPYSLDEHSQSL